MQCDRRETVERSEWDDIQAVRNGVPPFVSEPRASRLTRAALGRYFEALSDFEPALRDYREEMLKNMDAYCPRAAKRIREGKPPRRNRKRTEAV
jgi:hypothetical protein